MWHGALHSYSISALLLELQETVPINVKTTNFPTILNIFNTFKPDFQRIYEMNDRFSKSPRYSNP